jgi:hypothetical protein
MEDDHMRDLTSRILTRTSRRARDDQGQATSEVIGLMALLAAIILALTGRLGDILNRVVDTIDAALPG